MNRFKIYLGDKPQIRSMIAQHIDIPEDPPESIQLYINNKAPENYFDPFDEVKFKSLQEEYEQRAAELDASRELVKKQKERTNQEKHFKSLEDIQNEPGIDFTERTRLMKQEWESFTKRSQHLFNYMQTFKFEEKIYMKKLAEYRRTGGGKSWVVSPQYSSDESDKIGDPGSEATPLTTGPFLMTFLRKLTDRPRHSVFFG